MSCDWPYPISSIHLTNQIWYELENGVSCFYRLVCSCDRPGLKWGSRKESYWTKGCSWLSWSHHFESFTVATMTWLTVMEYSCHGYAPLVVSTSRSFPHSWLITGFVTRLTRRMPLVKQELPTLPEHLSSPPVFSGVRVTRSLVLCVCFVDRCLSFCPFSSGHFVVCSSLIYGFRLPFCYLQTLLFSLSYIHLFIGQIMSDVN